MANSAPLDLNVLSLKSRITVNASYLIRLVPSFCHLKMHSRCTSALIIDNNNNNGE